MTEKLLEQFSLSSGFLRDILDIISWGLFSFFCKLFFFLWASRLIQGMSTNISYEEDVYQFFWEQYAGFSCTSLHCCTLQCFLQIFGVAVVKIN